MIPLHKPYIKRRELDGVLTALVNEQIMPGVTVQKLEHELREFMKADACVALSSHFVALTLWRELYAGEFSGTTMTPFSAGSLGYFYRKSGIPLKIYDFEPLTPNLNPEEVPPAEDNDQWVYLIHHMGYMPDTSSFRNKNYRVAHDITESFGSYRDLKLAGSDGDAAFLRLDPTGWMNAAGGCLLFIYGKKKSGELKEILKSLPDDLRLSDMNVALALVQWQDREKIFKAKKEIFSHLALRISRSSGRLPHQGGDAEQIMPCLPLLLEQGSQDVQAYAEKKGIEVAMAFSLDSQLAALDSFPNARNFYLRCLQFPLYPSLNAKDAEILGKVLSTLP